MLRSFLTPNGLWKKSMSHLNPAPNIGADLANTVDGSATNVSAVVNTDHSIAYFKKVARETISAETEIDWEKRTHLYVSDSDHATAAKAAVLANT
jgi:hypothetical protein